MKLKIRSDKNRKLNLDLERINLYCSRWKPDTEFEVEIKRHEVTISHPMRKYYWSVVLPTLCKELGYEPDDYEQVHTQLKARYFRIEPDERGIYKDMPSVFGNESDKTLSEKNEFVEYVKRVGAKYGIYIRDPE